MKDLKIMLIIINFIIFYFIILRPYFILKELTFNKKVLIKEYFNVEKMNKTKEEYLKNLLKNNEVLKIENKRKIKESENKNFQNIYSVFDYLESLIKENRIKLNLIGREVFENIDDNKVKGSFFIEIEGNEKDIFNFIYELENSTKKISFMKSNFIIEDKGDTLELKVNIMYIVNNNIEKFVFEDYINGQFKNKKSRNIWKKRREI